ncbi:ABC transporter ATP-binding protein [Veillonella sp. CNR 79/14]|jgi:oligopeptide ABC transporter, ATP-binding protein oppD|uniref:ABC transporter ATP-binding protein n=1 Tax=Veillonella sp. CNR 79/14 TaxID=2490954 RepID=UPI000F8C8267|nr:ABC transporter ATP-binding protein [Veillonella sp. CNR 79/14]
MLLSIKNLAVTYGNNSNPTIAGVNLDLAEGEIVSIVGESGSGKTTVIRALLGVLPNTGRVSEGSITFDGQDLLGFSTKDWLDLRGNHIAMIFQDSGNMMNPIQTIGKQFVEFIQLHSTMSKQEAEAKAIEMLALTNLPHPEAIMKSYPFELSGGMRQRVGIAMAITFSPKLLLGDEPTSALDVTTQAQIVEELLRINRENKTSMIIVTHNIGVAAHMSDKIMVMKQGAVVEYGPAEEIIRNPQAEYTKQLLNAVPEIGGKRYV